MTAPRKDRDKIYRKWGQWIEVVRLELVHAHHHQNLWTQVRDAAVARHPDADHTWLLSYSYVYHDAQISLIRRVAEDSKTTASLGRLVRSIRDQPTIMTRTRYCNVRARHGMTKSEAGADWDRLFAASPGDEQIDPRIPGEDYDSLTSGKLHRVIMRAHKTVAHIDGAVARAIQAGRKPKVNEVTYGDIRGALADLAAMANTYLNLLKHYETEWTPALIGDWEAPLRASLFPFDPSIFVYNRDSLI